MRFSVYFDSILNEKWLLSYRNNDIIAAHMLGAMLTSREKLENMCNLVRLGMYFDQILH